MSSDMVVAEQDDRECTMKQPAKKGEDAGTGSRDSDTFLGGIGYRF